MYILTHPVEILPLRAMPATDQDEPNEDFTSNVESNMKKRKRVNEIDKIVQRFVVTSVW